jgi:hypothetical protein
VQLQKLQTPQHAAQIFPRAWCDVYKVRFLWRCHEPQRNVAQKTKAISLEFSRPAEICQHGTTGCYACRADTPCGITKGTEVKTYKQKSRRNSGRTGWLTATGVLSKRLPKIVSTRPTGSVTTLR